MRYFILKTLFFFMNFPPINNQSTKTLYFRIFSRKRLKLNFAKKAKIFACFASERNVFFSRKIRNFSKTIFVFRWKPYFKDDCAKFILSVSLLSRFPATVNIFASLPNHWISIHTFTRGLSYFMGFPSSIQSHHLLATLYQTKLI